MICVDPRNPRAAALADRLAGCIDLGALPADLALVLGGDGWMLQSIRDNGPELTYLGINAGRLGFLLNDPDDYPDLFQRIAQGRYRAHRFPRLQMQAWTQDGSVKQADAVNDLYLERASGQTAHLALRVDGEEAVGRLVCDGLVVATALGSTAYSYSAGGVPCHPLVPSLHITPIAPHAPRLSPMVLPLDSVVEIVAHVPERRPVRAVCDGVEQGEVVRMRVARGPHDVRLAFVEGHAFTSTLVRKVLNA